MTVYKEPFPLARTPAARPAQAPAPAVPAPSWPDGARSADEYAYMQAVRRAFGPKPWQAEEDPLTTWLWEET